MDEPAGNWFKLCLEGDIEPTKSSANNVLEVPQHGLLILFFSKIISYGDYCILCLSGTRIELMR